MPRGVLGSAYHFLNIESFLRCINCRSTFEHSMSQSIHVSSKRAADADAEGEASILTKRASVSHAAETGMNSVCDVFAHSYRFVLFLLVSVA